MSGDIFQQKQRYTMQDLLAITALLRNPVHGCPWDKAQTHASIRINFLEETYEVADAIDLGNMHLLCEELGDVLLQVALHTQMEAEQNTFTFEDVTTGICEKLILRHPHIFGDVIADTPQQVLQNWEAIKRTEKHRERASDNLESVPAALPALMRSRKVQKRAGDYGFCYEDVHAAMADLESELAELKTAIAAQDSANMEEELGDLLFSVVNVSRYVKIEPEQALQKSTAKFVSRFQAVERLAEAQGRELSGLSVAELDKLWKTAKLAAHVE